MSEKEFTEILRDAGEKRVGAMEVRASLREGHPLVQDTVELYVVSLRESGREEEALQLEAQYPAELGR